MSWEGKAKIPDSVESGTDNTLRAWMGLETAEVKLAFLPVFDSTGNDMK